MNPVYSIDARRIRRDRFRRSKFAGHLRFAIDLILSTLICYALVFGVVGIFWFINSLLGR